MKKYLLLALAAVALNTTTASAQDWLDALKGVASNAIDKATGGKLTEKAIIGTWKYSEPAIKLSSDDSLSDLAASALSSSLQERMKSYYQKVGIKSGACSYTFNADGTFSSTFGRKTSKGTYVFDGQTAQIKLTYESGILKLKAITAYAYMNGENLQITFPMDKALDLLTSLGSSISSLSAITSMLNKYDSMKLGFEFSK